MASIPIGVALTPKPSPSPLDGSGRSSEEGAAGNSSFPTLSTMAAAIIPTSALPQTSHPPFPGPSQPQSESDHVHTIAERLLNVAQGRQGDCQEWESYRVTPRQWKQVRALARKALRSEKIRYDYDPFRGELVIRMPYPKHDLTAVHSADLVFDSLCEQLDPSQRHQVYNRHTSDIIFDNGAKKSPDNSINNCNNPHHPVFILEIGYSHKPTAKLAEDYMVLSGTITRTVFCFNLMYTRDTVKSHEIAIYRLKEDPDKFTCSESAVYILRSYHENDVSTDHDGAVRLYPSDFGFQTQGDAPFDIPFAKFLDIADDAETMQQVEESAPPCLALLHKPFERQEWDTPEPEEESDESPTASSSGDSTYVPSFRPGVEHHPHSMTTRSRS